MGDDKQTSEKTTFLVGPDGVSFEVYSDILAASSPVFKTMMFGSMADKSGPIQLKGDCPEAFRALIEYVLSKRLVVEDSGEALRLAKMAHKYMMPELMKECMEYKDGDHWYALEYYELLKLTNNDEKLISNDKINETLTKCQLFAEELLEWNRHLNVSVSTLIDLFMGDGLNVTSEMTLVEALARYEEKNDDSSLKDGLRMALSHIRLLTLKPQQIIECGIIKKLLGPEDIRKILGKIVSPSNGEEMPKNLSNSLVCRGRYWNWNRYKYMRTSTERPTPTILKKHTICTADLLQNEHGATYILGVIFGVAGNETIPLLDIIMTVQDANGTQLVEERYRLRNLTCNGKICMFGKKIPLGRDHKHRLNVLIMNRVSLSGRFFGQTPRLSIECKEEDPINFILKGLLIW